MVFPAMTGVKFLSPKVTFAWSANFTFWSNVSTIRPVAEMLVAWFAGMKETNDGGVVGAYS